MFADSMPPISGQILLDYLLAVGYVGEKTISKWPVRISRTKLHISKVERTVGSSFEVDLSLYIYRYMHIGLQFLRGHDAIIMKNRQIHAARSCNVLNVGDIILAEVSVLRCLVQGWDCSQKWARSKDKSFAWTWVAWLYLRGILLEICFSSKMQFFCSSNLKDGLSTWQAYPDEAAEECGEVFMGVFPWKEQHVADFKRVPAPFLQAWFYLYSCCHHEHAAAH